MLGPFYFLNHTPLVKLRIPPTYQNSACWDFESLHPCNIKASAGMLGLFYVYCSFKSSVGSFVKARSNHRSAGAVYPYHIQGSRQRAPEKMLEVSGYSYPLEPLEYLLASTLLYLKT
jgi:hypothetical protein